MQSKSKLPKLMCGPLLAAAAMALTSLPASADTPVSDRGAVFAIGGAVGSARINSSNFDDDDTAVKGFAGVNFGDVLGLEVQYIDFGSYQRTAPIVGDADFDAFTGAITVGFPLPWARPYGKLGYAFQDAEGASLSQEISDDEVFYGVGLSFGPWRSPLSLKLEYERFEFDNDDLDLASLGLAFRFGGHNR